MNSPANSFSNKAFGFFKIIAAIVSFFGGTAAVFIAFGYITLLSCVSKVHLYGLFNFNSQYYKEAFITFLHDLSDYFSGHLIRLLIALIIACSSLWVPSLLSIIRLSKPLRKKGRLLAIFSSIYVIFLTLSLDYFENIFHTDFVGAKNIFYLISLPVMATIVFFIFKNYEIIYSKEFPKSYVISFLLIFVALFISIPIGYGTYLYKLPIFESEAPELVENVELVAFQKSNKEENKLFYFMGQLSDKDIYFDLTDDNNKKIILVEKALVRASKVIYSTEQDLRDALKRPLIGGKAKAKVEGAEIPYLDIKEKTK